MVQKNENKINNAWICVNCWKYQGTENSSATASENQAAVTFASASRALDKMTATLQEIPEDSNEDEERLSPKIEPTPYERLLQAVHDPKFSHEVTLEKRVGLYKFCGDIGRGNFSRVKKAVHLLTKGEIDFKGRRWLGCRVV